MDHIPRTYFEKARLFLDSCLFFFQNMFLPRFKSGLPDDACNHEFEQDGEEDRPPVIASSHKN